MAIDDLRELALQAAERLARRLVLGELAIEVVPSGSRVHRLDPSCEMQRVVERAVAAPGQTVAGDLAAGDLDRGRTGVAREVIRRPEPADVTDMTSGSWRQAHR